MIPFSHREVLKVITSMAQKVSSFFVFNDMIREEDEEVYSYCFEILFSTVINFAFVVAVSIIFNKVPEMLFYLAGFIPLRRAAGGFHAKTHFRCFCTLVVTYSVFLMILSHMSGNLNCFILFILQGFSTLFVFMFAPIQNENRPISKEERVRFQRKSRLIILAGCLFSMIILLFSSMYAFSFIFGSFTASLSLFTAQIMQRRKNDEKN